jgi:hypothetical protein
VSYLFGDSTPAPFSSDVLEALRDALDFTCTVASCDACIASADARKQALRAAADTEAAGLETLARATLAIASPFAASERPPRAAALADALGAFVSKKHEAAANALTAKLERDVRAVDDAVAAARDRYRATLEAYLLHRDPPFARTVKRIASTGRGRDGDAYVATIEAQWDVGLAWTIALGVPERSPWKKPVRIGDLVADLARDLEVHAPRRAGFFRRSVELRKQRLERLFVTKLIDDGTTVSVELRADVTGERGFDFSGDLAHGTVSAARTGGLSDEGAGPFALSIKDEAKLVVVLARLRALFSSLARMRIAAVAFDGKAFDGNDLELQPKLVAIVPRIVKDLAPAVHEIDRRSHAEGELVLRHELADGCRHETFLQKRDIRERIAALDEAHREFFEPLPLTQSKVASTRDDRDEHDEHDERNERLEESYRRYASMLASDAFRACKAEVRRRALKRMVLAKPPVVSDGMREAHRAAIGALQRLVLESHEPADYEMLGMAYAVIDEPGKANEIFKKAHDLARSREESQRLLLTGT